MSDENDDTVEVDGNHPWIQAAMHASPQAVPSSMKIEPVEIPNPKEPGKNVQAALVTLVDITGVKNAFLPPQALAQFLEQGMAIFDYWESNKKEGLVVADKGMEQAAKVAHDQQRSASDLLRGR